MSLHRIAYVSARVIALSGFFMSVLGIFLGTVIPSNYWGSVGVAGLVIAIIAGALCLFTANWSR